MAETRVLLWEGIAHVRRRFGLGSHYEDTILDHYYRARKALDGRSQEFRRIVFSVGCF
jgi:hypothetical protein